MTKCFAKQAQKPFASSKFVIMASCLVILSASEVSIKLKCVLNSVDISPTAQYDNAGFCFEFLPCANALYSK